MELKEGYTSGTSQSEYHTCGVVMTILLGTNNDPLSCDVHGKSLCRFDKVRVFNELPLLPTDERTGQ